jgi:hypothetical protein
MASAEEIRVFPDDEKNWSSTAMTVKITVTARNKAATTFIITLLIF